MLRIRLKGLILPKGIYRSISPILKKLIIAAACGRFSSDLAVISVSVTKCELKCWLREMH